MSDTVGTARIDIRADTARFRSDVSGLGSSLTSSFRRIAVAAGGIFAGVQIGRFVGDAVREAADLGESINAVRVVAGDAADSFLAFGQDAANSLGITQAALNQAITPIAALLRNAGSGGEVLSGQMQDLASRATDVASVFNTDVNTVLEAFGSALRGEQEPIRQFGVNLDQAAIDAEAVRLGLAGANGEVDRAARSQAALSLIMAQTNVAMGDFANTADSLPNLMRRFDATLADTQAALGSALLPALTQVLGAFQGLLPAIEPLASSLGIALGAALTAIAPALQTLASALGEGLAQLAPAFIPIGDAIGAIASAVAPLIPVFAQLVALIAGGLAQAIGTLANALAPVLAIFADLATQVFNVLGPAFDSLQPAIAAIAEAIGSGLATALEAAAPSIVLLAESLAVMVEAAAPLGESLAPLFETLFAAINPLLPVFAQFASVFATEFAALIPAIIPSIDELVAAFIELAPSMADILAAVTALTPVITILAQLLAGALVGSIRINVAVWQGLVAIVNAMQGVMTFFFGIAQTVAGFLSGVFAGAVNAVSSAFGAMQGVVSTVRSAFQNVFGVVQQLASILAGVLAPAIAVARAAFTTIVGVINTIRSAISNLIGAVGRLIDRLASIRIPDIIGAAGDIIGDLFADGGIVTRPTLALVGEAGPEAIVPLTRPARAQQVMQQAGLRGGGGGRAVEVHIHSVDGLGDADVRRITNRLAAALL